MRADMLQETKFIWPMCFWPHRLPLQPKGFILICPSSLLYMQYTIHARNYQNSKPLHHKSNLMLHCESCHHPAEIYF
nr:hypothetical protein Iba_chr12bCG1860 [Ipomoea batatas]